MDQQEWVRLLLTDERIHRLPARPWAVEAALRRVRTSLERFPEHASIIEEWAVPSATGWRFPKLTSVIWALAAAGDLVPSRALGGGCYVVDPWRRDQQRQRLAELPPQVRRAVVDASGYLASLTATRSTSSKTA